MTVLWKQLARELRFPDLCRLSYRKKCLEQEVINTSSCHLSGVFRIQPFVGRCQI